MSDNSNSSSGGIGLSGVLFVVFLTLKLTGNIDWSWWWVTSPLWGSFLFFIAIFVIVICIDRFLESR